MAHLIDKDAVVAEIERRRESNAKERYFGRLVEDNYFLDFIDTLEVKEVDLEKEIDSAYRNHVAFGRQEIADVAKHFFELGLKKGQKNIWHSMDKTPNYPCDILFLTDVDNMFLYRYMENGRPVDRETPYFGNILNGKCWCYCDDVKTQKGE